MNIIYINNFSWWLIIFLNFVGYFILRFAMISNGSLKEVDKAVGIILTTASFVLMLVFFGFVQMVLLLFILWIFITPLVMFTLNKIENKLYPYRREVEERLSEEYGIPVDELRRRKDLTTEEMLREVLPGMFKEDSDVKKVDHKK